MPELAIRSHEQQALALDAADPLRAFRAEFLMPRHGETEQRYFCGNSLGLQPRGVRAALMQELDDWGALGVEAHFRGKTPWMPYHESVRAGLADSNFDPRHPRKSAANFLYGSQISDRIRK